MAQTYIAYANSLDGLTGFSLERGNRQYLGRFVDRNYAEVEAAINAPIVIGDERNLLLNTKTERTSETTGNDIALSYDSTALIASTQQHILSFDAILVDDLGTAEPKITPFYPTNPALYGEDIPITASWQRYSQIMPVGVSNYSSVAVHSNVDRDSDSQCVFAIKNVKLELGDKATTWKPSYEDMLTELDTKILDPTSYEWHTIRNSTNNDWWSTQGVVRSKAVLAFADDASIEVFGSDYIRSWSVTQDLSSNNDDPVFDFVSDRLEMTLYSLDNDFNPFAENSQYYGKFILGTKITLYTKVDYLGTGDELNWDKIGEFKVAEIEVSPTGTEAFVLAYDYGYDGIENSKQQILAPLHDVETLGDVEGFFEDVFPDYNISIQEDIDIPQGKLFPLEDKLKTMNELLAALFCFSRCDGNDITIGTFDDVRTGILDRTNIVSLTPEQSLTSQYSDSVVRWNEIGLKSGTEIISILADFASAGEKTYNNVSFEDYINKLEETVCISKEGSNTADANISDVYSNALTLTIENSQAGEIDVKVIAETLTFNEIAEGSLDNAESVYGLSNKYIQTKAQAQALKLKLDNFVTTANQYCGAEVRFNPLLKLASLVECEHADYGIDIEGYIVEQTLEVSDTAPSGRQSLVLLNKEAVL